MQSPQTSRLSFRRSLGFACLGSVVGACSGGAGVDSGGAAWFAEVARESGIDFRHRLGSERRYRFPECVVGGVAAFDYDDDGYLDLYFVQSGELGPDGPRGEGNRLYRNLGGLRFEDVTTAAGVGDPGYGMGCTAADYDGDGHVDLYVTNVGANVLYRNLGDGSFADVTAEAGVGSEAWGSSAAFLDYDEDGDLDLFVVNYIQWSLETEIECLSGVGRPDYCDPNNYQSPAPDLLYRNDGDGTFTDVTERAGLGRRFGNGLGVTCGDFDGDGRIDVFVANDGMANQMWVNTGQGVFEDRSFEMACGVSGEGKSEAGMGVAAVDLEDDGDLDLFLSHLRDETNTLYLNAGDWFEDATPASGLAHTSSEYTGFGLGFADFDHDGRLDLYVANGRVKRPGSESGGEDPYAEPNLLYVQAGEGLRFDEVLPRGGTARELVHTSRGAAFGDLDNDGDVDIAVANAHAAPYLLRNDAARGNWIMLRVLDRGVDSLHAGVAVRTAGAEQHRRVERAYSYCASSDARVHFGIGEQAAVESVVVTWPSGGREEFGPFDANALYEIEKGSGRELP